MVGRPSTVSQILEYVQDISSDDDDLHLVFYDWPSGNSTNQFYKSLTNLQNVLPPGAITRLQHSIYSCKGLKATTALYRLAKHYGMDVAAYSAKAANIT